MFDSANISIFAGSGGQTFAERMCRYMGRKVGNSEVITFSEGNTFVRINESVRDRDVYLVQPIGMHSNNEFVEILFWMDAFKRANALTVTLVMPYFAYAKGDKKDEPRVSIRARVCAECMELAGAARFVTMDLHAQQVQGFFKKPIDVYKRQDFARAQLDRFLDVTARVRRGAFLAHAHIHKAKGAEAPLRVERQRQRRVGVFKDALRQNHAVIALRARIFSLRLRERAQQAGDLRPDRGHAVRVTDDLLHGRVGIFKDRRKVALCEAGEHVLRQGRGVRLRQSRHRRDAKQKNQQKYQHMTHMRAPFLRSL